MEFQCRLPNKSRHSKSFLAVRKFTQNPAEQIHEVDDHNFIQDMLALDIEPDIAKLWRALDFPMPWNKVYAYFWNHNNIQTYVR